MLTKRGHEVAGMTRSPQKAGALQAMGVKPYVADGLDRDAVIAAVTDFGPEVVVHQMTQIGDFSSMRNLDRLFEPTNRLRTEGTDNLLAAARAAGARRFVAQSFAGWPYARVGGPVKTESDPLDDDPPKKARETLHAIRHVEATVTAADDIEGIVLRYGGFYGPGTGLDPASGEGDQVELVRRRKFPVVGDGGGVWSLVHIEDAAAATLEAIEHGAPGIYNVVDDEPAPVAAWLPVLADAIGAKPPMHVPKFVGLIAAGEVPVTFMTEIRGASNAKAKRELGWKPRHPSWRQGFKQAA
jgi:nucleoside-diphosphate-sugar epimerase